MRQLSFIFLLMTYSYTSNAIQTIYLSAKPISCQSYSYEIELLYSSWNVSEVIFGEIEINYGDGIIEEFPVSDYSSISIENKIKNAIYVRGHSFSGPGIYIISARLFNRGVNIKNMDNSINTPMRVEMKIYIDPFLGCNQTPKLENIPTIHKMASTYFYDFSFIDKENDSISFQFTTPLQSANTPVVNYWLPDEMDEIQSRKISKISIDPFNGSFLWNIKDLDGRYSVAFKVNEWRKVDGVYYQISSSTMDYLIDLQNTENNYPEINGHQDTAIIAGNNFAINLAISDPDDDSIQVRMYGDFFQLMDVNQNEEMDFLPGPIEKSINFTPSSNHVRVKPYKTVITATDKNDSLGSLSNSESMYIWITDRDHEPDPRLKIS